MKRSDALAPLSRDHHQALVVARELRRAGAADADTAAQRFVRFLEGHELAHFGIEEAVLLPVVSDEEQGRELTRRVLEDHAFLRDAMRRLRDSPDAPSVQFLHAVGTRLREHVRMEEHELFPYLEGLVDEPALEEIGRRLRHPAQ